MPNLSRLAALIGWFGVAVFLGTAVVTAIGYTGSAGEPYSPLNHYVSELGEIKNSELSVVFNSGIAIGGICLAVLLVEVGRRIGGRARAGSSAGSACWPACPARSSAS